MNTIATLRYKIDLQELVEEYTELSRNGGAVPRGHVRFVMVIIQPNFAYLRIDTIVIAVVHLVMPSIFMPK